jgi:hypothetical protein
MGLLSLLSPVTKLLGLDVGAKAQVQSAGYQYQASAADTAANERIANKSLELDRDKFEFLKTQAASPVGQTGSYGYPYVAVKQYKAAPLITMPIVLAGGLLFFVFRRKR